MDHFLYEQVKIEIFSIKDQFFFCIKKMQFFFFSISNIDLEEEDMVVVVEQDTYIQLLFVKKQHHFESNAFVKVKKDYFDV
jgi:hypothetical protein